jgi:hypothetical protein
MFVDDHLVVDPLGCRLRWERDLDPSMVGITEVENGAR